LKLDESFGPDKELMKLYYSYLLIVDAAIFLGAILPAIVLALVYLSLFEMLVVMISIILPFLVLVGFVAFWIPRYYASVSYAFTEGEISVEKGVWWRHNSTVPYNRVTNIDIVQGPISRRFCVAKVRVQTAGYSATGGGGAVAEASIFGVKDFKEIMDFILEQVRRLRPVAAEAGTEAAVPTHPTQQMIEELKKIRKILEEQTTKK
jgi:membrane protein YdbS with pleckstrin-like domain